MTNRLAYAGCSQPEHAQAALIDSPPLAPIRPSPARASHARATVQARLNQVAPPLGSATNPVRSRADHVLSDHVKAQRRPLSRRIPAAPLAPCHCHTDRSRRAATPLRATTLLIPSSPTGAGPVLPGHFLPGPVWPTGPNRTHLRRVRRRPLSPREPAGTVRSDQPTRVSAARVVPTRACPTVLIASLRGGARRLASSADPRSGQFGPGHLDVP